MHLAAKLFTTVLCCCCVLPLSGVSFAAAQDGVETFRPMPPTPAPPTPIPSAQLSPAERDALDRLYFSTDGPNWHDNEGWNNYTAYENVCYLVKGISCDGYGNLYQITLHGNGLRGPMPTYDAIFKHFPNLRIIIFTNNLGLTGAIPDFPSSHPMTTVEVGSCSLSGTIPTAVFTPTLEHFDCSNNLNIHGEIPPAVGNAPRLVTFVVGSNQLSGNVPGEICNCRNLQQLDVSDNALQQLPFACIGTNLKHSMQILNIAKNYFSMQFPAVWCDISNLRQIFLQDNTNLFGELPPACTWPQMTDLIIENTQMSGAFPVQVFGMSNLVTLILSLSNFNGDVPDRFDNLPQLQTVGLNGIGPSFQYTWTGPLPKTLFSHINIVTLTIQYTHFTGSMPAFDTRMVKLSHITIASNVKFTSTGEDFPVAVLSIWRHRSPIGQNRTLYIPNNNFGGLLPDINFTLFNLSHEPSAIHFASNNWIGYIPLSLLDWVPWPSQNAMLFQCSLLFAPIAPALQHLVDVTSGFQWSIISASPSSIPRHHGFSLMSVGQARTGTNCVFDSYADQFTYRCSFCYADDFIKQTRNSWCANLSNVQAYSAAYINLTTCSFECNVPGGGVLRNGPNQVRIVYHGVSSEGVGHVWAQDLSNRGTVIQIYEDQPPIYNMTPSVGRYEGCTRVSMFGSLFGNLPSPTLVIGPKDALDANETNQPHAITTLRGNVINDGEIQFVVPFATPGNNTGTFVNQTRNGTGTLFAQLFPAGTDRNAPGVIVTKTPLRRDLNYSFSHAHCRTPLVSCRHGHVDPENCPTPMCRCSSNGGCRLVNVTLNISGDGPTMSTTDTVPPQMVAGANDVGAVPAAAGRNSVKKTSSSSSIAAMRYLLSSSSVVGRDGLAGFDGGERRRSSGLQARDGRLLLSNGDRDGVPLVAESAPENLGYYLLNTTEYECVCDMGFNGTICQYCDLGFWGQDCTMCDCDHGSCDDGIHGTGNCHCNAWYWMGHRCQLNFILISCSVIGSVILIYAAYKIRKEWVRIKTWWHGSKCVVWWRERKERQQRDHEEKERLRQTLLLVQADADKVKRDERDDNSRADDFAGYEPFTSNSSNSKPQFIASGATPQNSKPNFAGYSVSRMYDDDPDEKRSQRSGGSGKGASSGAKAARNRSEERELLGEDAMAIADAVTGPLTRMADAYLSSSDDDDDGKRKKK